MSLGRIKRKCHEIPCARQMTCFKWCVTGKCHEFPVHMKWYMVMGASWENVIKFHLNGKWHVLWRFTGNVIKFHVHVKWYVFSGTSWGNVIELHVHVKWYIFMGASRENVIKIHLNVKWHVLGRVTGKCHWIPYTHQITWFLGACHCKMSYNFMYTSNYMFAFFFFFMYTSNYMFAFFFFFLGGGRGVRVTGKCHWIPYTLQITRFLGVRHWKMF